MNITIIGTGNMGAGLAAALVQSGHAVSLGARDPAKAVALAEKLGHGVVGGGIQAAAKLADLVILALPFGAYADAVRQADGLAGKVVVDISNPISADFRSLVIGHTSSAAEELQKLAPKARVIKAFNTIFSTLLDQEARVGQTLQVFVAGDDGAAKAAVSEVARSMAFEPVDAGPLTNSRFLEPVGEMNIHFGFFLGKGPKVAPAWVQL